jgi:hypothetical protein
MWNLREVEPECASARQLIQNYFSDPGAEMAKWKYVPDAKVLGRVRFRPSGSFKKAGGRTRGLCS